MKIKKILKSVREKKPYVRYLIIFAVNVVFFSLMSLFFIGNAMSVSKNLTELAIFLLLFIFSVVYGFLSCEISDNIFWGNLMYVVLGGIWMAFVAYSILPTQQGNLLYTMFYFCRYGIAAFFVSLVIKNTRK